MSETFLPLTHLLSCSTLSLGWNLRPVNSCHPECSLTVTTKPPWGDCDCKQLLKPHIWDCAAVHRSGLHIVNTSPFQTHKQCSFVALDDAPPLPLSSRAQCIGECREANAELLCSLFTGLSRSCFPINSWVCRRQKWRLSSVGCYAAASSPSGSDVSKPQGIGTFTTVIGVWPLFLQ